MRAYIISLMSATVFASLLCGIFPKDGEGKWVNFAAGIAITCVVLTPLFSSWSLPDVNFTTQEFTVESNKYLMDTFEETLSREIVAHVREQTGENVEVTVLAQTDEAGEILGVYEVWILPFSEKTATCIANLLEIDSSRVVEK